MIKKYWSFFDEPFFNTKKSSKTSEWLRWEKKKSRGPTQKDFWLISHISLKDIFVLLKHWKYELEARKLMCIVPCYYIVKKDVLFAFFLKIWFVANSPVGFRKDKSLLPVSRRHLFYLQNILQIGTSRYSKLQTICVYTNFIEKFALPLFRYKHPFYVPNPSPWPVLTSISVFFIVFSLFCYIHFFNYISFMFWIGFILFCICVFSWWRDIIREATFEGQHTKIVQRLLKISIQLFIISEIMFFFSFFWAFFHSSLAPVHDIGGIWPPKGIEIFNWKRIPLYNTLILLTSGAFVTAAHAASKVSPINAHISKLSDAFRFTRKARLLVYFSFLARKLWNFTLQLNFFLFSYIYDWPIKYMFMRQVENNPEKYYEIENIFRVKLKGLVESRRIKIVGSSRVHYMELHTRFDRDRFGPLLLNRFIQFSFSTMPYSFFFPYKFKKNLVYNMFSGIKIEPTRHEKYWELPMRNKNPFRRPLFSSQLRLFIKDFSLDKNFVLVIIPRINALFDIFRMHVNLNNFFFYLFRDRLSFRQSFSGNSENKRNKEIYYYKKLNEKYFFIRPKFKKKKKKKTLFFKKRIIKKKTKLVLKKLVLNYVELPYRRLITESYRSSFDKFLEQGLYQNSLIFFLMPFKHRCYVHFANAYFFIFKKYVAELYNSMFSKQKLIILNKRFFLQTCIFSFIWIDEFFFSLKNQIKDILYFFWREFFLRRKAHSDLSKRSIFYRLSMAISLGVFFEFLQYMEYKVALFEIADGIYGSVFYMATGFHGIHVIIGLLFLLVVAIRVRRGHFVRNHQVGFDAAVWYWHFVDAVWLLLYGCLYWWGS